MSDSGRTVELKDMEFNQPIPLKHLQPLGLMPNSTESCALWYFLCCAFQALDRVEKQTTLEGNEDQVVDLMQIATTVMRIYDLKEVDGMFNGSLVEVAKREAHRCRMPWDVRIDAFFASGGKSYRLLDRDPDKVGQ